MKKIVLIGKYLDNQGKPWDNGKTKRELGFESVWNAEDVIEN